MSSYEYADDDPDTLSFHPFRNGHSTVMVQQDGERSAVHIKHEYAPTTAAEILKVAGQEVTGMDITRTQAETITDYYLTKFQDETGFTNATELQLHQLRRHLSYLIEGPIHFWAIEEALDSLHNLDQIKDGSHEEIELSPNLFIDNRAELEDQFTRLYNKSLTDIIDNAGYYGRRAA